MNTTLKPHQQMGTLINGYRVAQIISVAAELGIADLLVDGPKSSAQLSKQTNTHEPSLYRVLRALAGYGVLAEVEGQLFELTEMGSTLRTDIPGTWAHMAIIAGSEFFRAPWGELLHGVRTGEVPSLKGYGMPMREFFDKNPRYRRLFDDLQTSNTETTTQALVDAYDFSSAKTVVDVGGGQGELLAAVLTSNPHLRGILVDVPAAIATAQSQLTNDPTIAERVEVMGMDFFESPLPEADTYMMKAVIHGLGDDRGAILLDKIKGQMTDGGRVLIIETMIPEFGNASPRMHFDINMMVMAGGVQRTLDEYRNLLDSVGYQIERVIESDTIQSIIEARPNSK